MKPSLFLAFVETSVAASAGAIIIGNSAGCLLDRKEPCVTARIGGRLLSDAVAGSIKTGRQ